MVSINSTVGQRIAYYREQKGLDQCELAVLVKIRTEYLREIETGKRAARIPRLARIAWALGMSLKELLGCEEEEG